MNRNTLLSLLVLLLPNVLFFGPMLISNQMFAYRDSGRFYFRQFQWNQAQWQQGRVPLWNPQENLGAPVVAEASSSVFYPLQLLFLIPGISFSTAFVLYAAIHVYLAGVGTFFLAKQLGCQPGSSLLAAIGFSYSGSFIFQTSNIVFLVGGCWLPYCLWMSWSLVSHPRLSPALLLGTFMALAVLGGDPQTAYHAVLISIILLFWKYLSRPKKAISSHLHQTIALHLLAVLLAGGIAAIQILPAWHATRSSTRAYTDHARSLWELPRTDSDSWLSGIFGHPIPATHHDHLYQFSQSPLSWIELVWPNVTGQIGNRNSRWVECLPGASRTWSPSIYSGLIILIFFLSAVTRRRKQAWSERGNQAALRDRWLLGCLTLFVVGACGWYGLGWVLHEICWSCWGMDPAKMPVGAPVGGIYWLLVVFLPGYVNFRYPAKLFLVATLLICLLAGLELQRTSGDQQVHRIRRWVTGLLSVSFLTILLCFSFSLPLNQWFGLLAIQVPSEWGPFDPQAAWSCILGGLLHSAILSIIILIMLNQGLGQRGLIAGLVLLSTVDLWVANRNLLLPARTSLWNRKLEVLEQVSEPGAKKLRFFRTDPMVWSTRNQWFQRRAENRLEQIVDFEMQTLMPRHHLATLPGLGTVDMLESFRSIESADFATLMAWLRQGRGIRTEDSFDVQLAPDLESLGLFACRYVLIPKWGKPVLPENSVIADLENHEALLVRNPFDQGRFRLVEKVDRVEPIEDLPRWLAQPENQQRLQNRTGYGGHFDRVLVESKIPLNLGFRDRVESSSNQPENSQNASEQVIEVVRETTTEIDLRVSAASGLLVIADQFDEDWSAFLVNENGSQTRLPLFRVDLIFRGIPLGSVDQNPNRQQESCEPLKIRMVYRPRWVVRGAWVSLIVISCYILLWLGLACRWSKSQGQK